MENPSKETLDKWRNDPNNWKWGLFYYNKEDNRLLVDKRNPNFGVTINFAHLKSYLFFLGIVCFFGLVIYMVSLKGN